VRPTRPLLLLCLAGSLLASCAGRQPQSSGAVIRQDEIALREREGYDLARQASAAQADGNDDRALELYQQAVGVWPEIPSAWNNMGLILMDRSNYMDAVEAFKTAARQNPTDPRPIINVGVAYDRTGWAEEALVAYVQALDRAPLERDALLGAITANHRLLRADRKSLERTRTALMIETDPATRAWLERERFRIESRINTQPDEATSITEPMPTGAR